MSGMLVETGDEFKIELVANFHDWNRHPTRPDWYTIKLSSGASSMIIPIDIFLKFSKGAQELLDKEKRHENW